MRLFSSRNNIAILQNSRVGVCLTLLLLLPLLFSCASVARYKGVGRIRRYTVADARLPQAFDGMTVAFLSDTHYPSKFTPKRLQNVVRALGDLHPDLLLLGGDYVTDLSAADELFEALGGYKAPQGNYAVLGNHDYRNARAIGDVMASNGIALLHNEVDTLRVGADSVFLCGIGSYDEKSTASICSHHAADGYTMLLVHSPDYSQGFAVKDVALQFSGHTHGGQVTLFGMYVPVKKSKYGRRFLSGLNFTDLNVPVVTSNGLGTSRRKVRFCAPSDIILVTLKRDSKQVTD